MTLRQLIKVTALTMLLALCTAASHALPVLDIAAEDLIRQSVELKKLLNLSQNQQILWQQVEEKIRPILRTRQSRREKIQTDIKLALDDSKTELRDWTKRLDVEEEMSMQEARQMRELCLSVNDALDDHQRLLVLNFLTEQVQRPAFTSAKPDTGANKPREEKHERGMSRNKPGGMNGGSLN